MTMGYRGVMTYLKLFGMSFFWAGAFVVGRWIAPVVGPFSAAFIRFAIASIVLCALLRWRENGFPPITKRTAIGIVILGLSGVALYNYLFFQGLHFIQANQAAIIIAINPVVVSAAAALWYRESMSFLKATGLVLSIAGAILTITKGDLSQIVQGELGWGELCIFGCVLSWVVYSLVGKTTMGQLSPLASVAYSSVVGAIALLIPAVWEGLTVDVVAYSKGHWFALGYLGVFATVLGFFWYYQGIKAVGASRASQFINFVPIHAIVLSYFFLDEPLTLSLGLGAALVMIGVIVVNRAKA